MLSAIAATVGTPCYVYDAAAIRRAYRDFDAALGDYPHAIHYALKANSSLGIVRLFKELGSSVDANSMGEVDVALRCGFHPSQIVMTGVGKLPGELARAVSLNLKAINVESAGELERLAHIAREARQIARVALRVNPDIESATHPHISTGLRSSKFGVPIDAAPALLRDLRQRPELRVVGLHSHIGSQITDAAPLLRAAQALTDLALAQRRDGLALEHLDVGGGLGITYAESPAPDLRNYAQRLVAIVRAAGLPLVVEPGRALIGAAGTLLTTVVDVKQWPGSRRFVVLDAGMTELLRPALYGSLHRILPVSPARHDDEVTAADVVGPICESSDTFGRDVPLPPVAPGDLLQICDVGAYGSVMASNYLRRPLCPEVLLDGEHWRVIRRRQTLDDLLALEEGPGAA